MASKVDLWEIAIKFNSLFPNLNEPTERRDAFPECFETFARQRAEDYIYATALRHSTEEDPFFKNAVRAFQKAPLLFGANRSVDPGLYKLRYLNSHLTGASRSVVDRNYFAPA